MPRHCSVCLHHELKAIDLALSAGEAVVPIGRRFGLAKSAVHRHKMKCLLGGKQAAEERPARSPAAAGRNKAPIAASPAAGAQAPAQSAAGAVANVPAVPETPDLPELVGCMVRSLRRLENAAEQAAGGGQGAALAAASGQLHKAVELLSRLLGAQGGGGGPAAPQVNIILPATTGYAAPTIDMPADGASTTPSRDRGIPLGAAGEPGAARITFTLPQDRAVPPRTTPPQQDDTRASPAPTPSAGDQPAEDAPTVVSNLRVPDFDVSFRV